MLNHFSRVRLFATQWSIARQAPLSMGFSRQEYWSGLPCPPPGDPPDLWMEPMSLRSPALAGRFFTSSVTWEALYNDTWEKKNHLFFWIKRNLCLFPLSEAGESPVLSLMLGDKNPLPFRESKGHIITQKPQDVRVCAVQWGPPGRLSPSMSASVLRFFHQGAWFSVLCPSAAAWQRPYFFSLVQVLIPLVLRVSGKPWHRLSPPTAV